MLKICWIMSTSYTHPWTALKAKGSCLSSTGAFRPEENKIVNVLWISSSVLSINFNCSPELKLLNRLWKYLTFRYLYSLDYSLVVSVYSVFPQPLWVFRWMWSPWVSQTTCVMNELRWRADFWSFCPLSSCQNCNYRYVKVVFLYCWRHI